MLNKRIIVISWIFLTMGAPLAAAEQPAALSDEALASYITGRVKQALSDEGHSVAQYCDASGCAVVVQ